MFTPDHLQKAELKAYIDNAKFFYIEGFFLTHGIESALEVAKTASGKGKVRHYVCATEPYLVADAVVWDIR
jgi:hypothetical protein